MHYSLSPSCHSPHVPREQQVPYLSSCWQGVMSVIRLGEGVADGRSSNKTLIWALQLSPAAYLKFCILQFGLPSVNYGANILKIK